MNTIADGRKMLQVMPDQWRFIYDEEKQGEVKSYTNTKAPSLFLAEVDGLSTVYINGEKVVENVEARTSFVADIAKAARAGENTVVVKADHSQISELALGGIIRPVYLIGE